MNKRLQLVSSILALVVLVVLIIGCTAGPRSTSPAANPSQTSKPTPTQPQTQTQKPKPTPTPTPPPASTSKPVIDSFTADPTSVTPPQLTELTWKVSNTDNVTIQPIVGAVPAESTVLITPQVTTTYTLTAVNSAGTATGTVTVTVVPQH